jgi:hypothetical protein
MDVMRCLLTALLLLCPPGCKVYQVYQLPMDDPAVERQRAWDELRAGHDRDGDGVITRAEFSGSDGEFRDLDANADGRLTREEFLGGRGGRPLEPGVFGGN